MERKMRLEGCHNKQRPDPQGGYYVLARQYMPDGKFYLEDQFVPWNFNDPSCQKGKEPMSSCEGCQHITGVTT